MTANLLDDAKQAAQDAIKDLEAFDDELRKQFQGGTPSGFSDVKGDDLARWMNLKMNQMTGFLADEMGNPILDEMGQQTMLEWGPDETGVWKWKPLTYEYGADWWLLLNHPNVRNGRELVTRYKRAHAKAEVSDGYPE